MKILYFTQTTCGPCKIMDKVLNKVSKVTGIAVTKIDASSKISTERLQYNIIRTPTIILINDSGKEYIRWNGIQREDILITKINEYK